MEKRDSRLIAQLASLATEINHILLIIQNNNCYYFPYRKNNGMSTGNLNIGKKN
jgi:hypothetical protein